MCGHFIMVPRDVIEEIVREVEIANYVNAMPDWPARRLDAYPQSSVTLILPEDNGLAAADLTWGYPVPWKSGVVFNTRFETAWEEQDSMWRESLLHRRCIIPSFGFFEPHRSEKALSARSGKPVKRQYRFDSPGGGLLFMAGIFEGDHFSLMTTKPNESVAPIHDRMPLVLEQSELATWLSDDFAQLADRSEIRLSATPQTPLAPSEPEQKTLW